MFYLCSLMGPLLGVLLFSVERFSLARSHLCFTWMFFSLRYQVKTPSSSGQSRHHQLPFVLPYPYFLEASLTQLRVSLAQFALSLYERALRLPTFFPFQVWPDLERNLNTPGSSGESLRSLTVVVVTPSLPRDGGTAQTVI